MSIQLSVAVVFGARLTTADDVRKALDIENNDTIDLWPILDGREAVVFVRASRASLASGRISHDPVYAFSRAACVSDGETVVEWDFALTLALEAAGINYEKISDDAWGWMVVCDAS